MFVPIMFIFKINEIIQKTFHWINLADAIIEFVLYFKSLHPFCLTYTQNHKSNVFSNPEDPQEKDC